MPQWWKIYFEGRIIDWFGDMYDPFPKPKKEEKKEDEKEDSQELQRI